MKTPKLTEMIQTMASDNEMILRPETDWEWPAVVGAQMLEAQAKRLTRAQRVDFTCGDHEAVVALTKKLGLNDLNIFMESVFDGEYTSRFFYRENDAPAPIQNTCSTCGTVYTFDPETDSYTGCTEVTATVPADSGINPVDIANPELLMVLCPKDSQVIAVIVSNDLGSTLFDATEQIL